MGRITTHRPALLLLAVFSRHEAALQWVRSRAEQQFGPVQLESGWFQFTESAYYAGEMGSDLKKGFLAFRELIDPARLPAIKHLSNAWEQELAGTGQYAEPRPLNVDPGYLTEAKLILATTKDRDHRVYLADGIYAEGTLYFQGGQWRTRPWTYPDYSRADYHQFFDACREYLRACYGR